MKKKQILHTMIWSAIENLKKHWNETELKQKFIEKNS